MDKYSLARLVVVGGMVATLACAKNTGNDTGAAPKDTVSSNGTYGRDTTNMQNSSSRRDTLSATTDTTMRRDTTMNNNSGSMRDTTGMRHDSTSSSSSSSQQTPPGYSGIERDTTHTPGVNVQRDSSGTSVKWDSTNAKNSGTSTTTTSPSDSTKPH
jgi:hypothetical protein